jgi:hypothetical protein
MVVRLGNSIIVMCDMHGCKSSINLHDGDLMPEGWTRTKNNEYTCSVHSLELSEVRQLSLDFT